MSISIVVVRGILSELQRRGIDPDEVLRASDLPHERIADVRHYITFDELERFVSNALEQTNDPGLGLAVGANAPETTLQVVGHLMRAHRTMREALAAWSRYSVLLTDAWQFRLLEAGELALFVCEPPVVHRFTRFFVDLTLTMAFRMGSHFALDGKGLREVRLQHRPPSYAARYQELFSCQVRFEQEHNALVFARELLDRPQLHADETVRTVLHEAVERFLRERNYASPLHERVRSLLQTPNDLATIDAAKVARRLGVSRRSLRRRLAAEGTSLPALLDEARCWLACRALRLPGASVKEVSELLHFSEPSAFHRAFKRWTGYTPTEYARLPAHEGPSGLPCEPISPSEGTARSP
jgi:AraC-like DNA-binding protein